MLGWGWSAGAQGRGDAGTRGRRACMLTREINGRLLGGRSVACMPRPLDVTLGNLEATVHEAADTGAPLPAVVPVAGLALSRVASAAQAAIRDESARQVQLSQQVSLSLTGQVAALREALAVLQPLSSGNAVLPTSDAAKLRAAADKCGTVHIRLGVVVERSILRALTRVCGRPFGTGARGAWGGHVSRLAGSARHSSRPLRP